MYKPKKYPQEVTFRSDRYDFSDSRVVGPGIWFSLLILAIRSDTTEKLLFACEHIKNVFSSMKCEVCRSHSTAYAAKFPPENTIKRKFGLYEWLVNLMNDVNRRNGKELYDYETLYKALISEETCSEDCDLGDNHGNQHNQEPSTVRVNVNKENMARLGRLNDTLPGVVIVQREGLKNNQTTQRFSLNTDGRNDRHVRGYLFH